MKELLKDILSELRAIKNELQKETSFLAKPDAVVTPIVPVKAEASHKEPITIQYLTKIAGNYARINGNTSLLNLLKSFGLDRVSNATPDKYKELETALKLGNPNE